MNDGEGRLNEITFFNILPLDNKILEQSQEFQLAAVEVGVCGNELIEAAISNCSTARAFWILSSRMPTSRTGKGRCGLSVLPLGLSLKCSKLSQQSRIRNFYMAGSFPDPKNRLPARWCKNRKAAQHRCLCRYCSNTVWPARDPVRRPCRFFWIGNDNVLGLKINEKFRDQLCFS